MSGSGRFPSSFRRVLKLFFGGFSQTHVSTNFTANRRRLYLKLSQVSLLKKGTEVCIKNSAIPARASEFQRRFFFFRSLVTQMFLLLAFPLVCVRVMKVSIVLPVSPSLCVSVCVEKRRAPTPSVESGRGRPGRSELASAQLQHNQTSAAPPSKCCT